MAWRASSAALLVAFLPAAAERTVRSEPCMGTVFRVTVEGEGAEEAIAAAFRRAHDLDGVLSDYEPDSESRQLESSSPGVWVPVSADLFAVLARSLEMARRTGGRFDPTLGPLTRAWRERRIPDAEEGRRLRERIGWRKVRLDRKRRRVRFATAGMQLDFGGIGKGYAAKEMLRVLRERGFPRALVAAGGDLAVGDAQGANRWKVEAGGRVLELANVAVSTSGDAEQRFEKDGRSYSHILDPAVGAGTPRRRAVTVISPDGAEADALATALSTMPEDRALAWAERHRIAALIGDRATSRFPK